MSLERFSLVGKRALVTGAGRGIGRAIAIALSEVGAEVTLSARSRNELEDTAREIAGKGGTATIVVGDIRDLTWFRGVVQSMGPVDIFVNNAGGNRPKPLSEVTQDDYDSVLDLNLKAVVFATQAVTGAMLAGGVKGSVINMSSQMGHVGAANRTLYCASKWALEGFTKALAVELGPVGIRVNTICPTFIETPMTKPFFEDPVFAQNALSKIKLGRIGQVEDVVGAAIYLASEASAMVTGSALLVDGGWTAD